MSIKLLMPSNHLIFCRPLLLLPSIFPSIRIFFNKSVLCIRWLKYWSFSFSISPSNEYSEHISFRIDLFDLLAVQGTLKSLIQHHNSKESILGPSAFFVAQLSHPYVTTGKTIPLTRWTFVGKVMSLLSHMLSRLSQAELQREYSPIHQQKIGLKIYWAWPCPSEQDPDSPTANPSRQEASTNPFFLSIRGQTELKPQSQKTNQTDHMDHNLVSLNETISHAM